MHDAESGQLIAYWEQQVENLRPKLEMRRKINTSLESFRELFSGPESQCSQLLESGSIEELRQVFSHLFERLDGVFSTLQEESAADIESLENMIQALEAQIQNFRDRPQILRPILDVLGTTGDPPIKLD